MEIHSLTCSDVMNRKVISVHMDDKFSLVEEQMRLYQIRHIPVVDSEKRLTGIVTQRDLFHAISPRRTESGDYYSKAALDAFVLKYVMTPDPVALKAHDMLREAVHIFSEFKYGCIPIVDDQKHLIGIISQVDILKLFDRFLHSK